MFTIQYFNQGAGEWRGTGSGSIADRETARLRMRALAEQCDYCVSFRIEPQLPSGTVEWL